MSITRWWLAAVLGLGCGLASNAFGAWANEYAVFGADSLTFLGYAKVSGGPAASNGDVSHMGGILELDALYGGGTLNPNPPVAWAASQDVLGNVVFNGAVTIAPLSDLRGAIYSGGNVTIGGNAGSQGVGGGITALGAVNVGAYNTIGGPITAGGSVTLGSGCTVQGAVGTNGDATLGIAVNVSGVVTHAKGFSMQSFSSVGGQVIGSVNPQPQRYTPVAVPPATEFISGGTSYDVATLKSLTLDPGRYGSLTFEGANRLYLHSGNYYFDSIASPGTFLYLYLDLSQGPINLFVTGDAQFERVMPYVNGVDFTQASTSLASLASQVMLEAHGSINMTGQFFGTMFAPHGDITTGTIGAVVGSVVAGHKVTIGSSTDVQSGATVYVPSAYLAAMVPEPGTVGVLVVAGAWVVGGRGRRRAGR